jgi:lipopolysaccharide biosynthesis regulator YciM
LQAFCEQRQTRETALHSLFTQHIIAVEAIRQMYALFQTANDLHGAINNAGNHHMKTVRTQVDRSEFLRSCCLFIYRHRLVRLFK